MNDSNRTLLLQRFLGALKDAFTYVVVPITLTILSMAIFGIGRWLLTSDRGGEALTALFALPAAGVLGAWPIAALLMAAYPIFVALRLLRIDFLLLVVIVGAAIGFFCAMRGYSLARGWGDVLTAMLGGIFAAVAWLVVRQENRKRRP